MATTTMFESWGVVGLALTYAPVPIAKVIANRDNSDDDAEFTFLTRSERQELPGAMTLSSI